MRISLVQIYTQFRRLPLKSQLILFAAMFGPLFVCIGITLIIGLSAIFFSESSVTATRRAWNELRQAENIAGAILRDGAQSSPSDVANAVTVYKRINTKNCDPVIAKYISDEVTLAKISGELALGMKNGSVSQKEAEGAALMIMLLGAASESERPKIERLFQEKYSGR